jgi:Protein of unknown function (DUF3105)
MRLAPLLLLVGVLAAACGGSNGEAEPAAPPPAEPAPAEPSPAGEPSADPSEEPADCVEETFTDQGAEHHETVPAGFEYNSFPPTSGPHHPQWAIWNVYSEPIQQLFLVHNLEHGGIIVQYGSGIAEDEVQRMIDWYSADPDAILVAPLPELGDKVALTAWTHLLTCSGFDEEAWTAFRDEHRFNGPESVPRNFLQPGL